MIRQKKYGRNESGHHLGFCTSSFDPVDEFSGYLVGKGNQLVTEESCRFPTHCSTVRVLELHELARAAIFMYSNDGKRAFLRSRHPWDPDRHTR